LLFVNFLIYRLPKCNKEKRHEAVWFLWLRLCYLWLGWFLFGHAGFGDVVGGLRVAVGAFEVARVATG
jgi:hypothetical protein